ncbi:class I SAM-dependent methyltransferase [Luteimicrobium sp. NPDC057192]|uniref:class I SAM-dependent methyltransferase n=1 Tax=Luteimicrobium sp. NPDC057192 TaxID=3346042 RepID=UPI003625494C
MPAPDPPPLPDAVTAVLAGLRRWPDIEGPDLLAADGADRLLLAELAGLLAGPGGEALTRAGAVSILDDAHGALTLGALTLGARGPRVWQDSVVAERALDANAERLGLAGAYERRSAGAPGSALVPADVTGGARLVLLRLPRSLAALTELAEAVAGSAAPDVVVLAGGMVKHMTPAMNDVLGRCFTTVHATRGRHKARVLVASGPREVEATYPVAEQAAADLAVWAYGAAFAGPRLDRGARALLEALGLLSGTSGAPSADRASFPPGATVLDLGCGTGVLATSVARAFPDARVVATDVSAAAVASTALTAEHAGVGDRVEAVRDDAGRDLPDATFDVVVCNPPFHVGAAVHTGAASRMFRTAARVLRPGGVLWTVYNSHLRYRAELARVVGPTTQVARDRTFTVTRSVASPAGGAPAHGRPGRRTPPEEETP